MLCITDIKIVNVDRDFLTICKMNNMPPFAPIINSDPLEYVEVKTEYIYGEKFVNANGERVCIGMSEGVQKAIGLPFEAFTNMKESLDYSRSTIHKLDSEVIKLKSKILNLQRSNIWQRIKFVFTGIK